MPEASVDKDDFVQAREDDIGLSRQCLDVKPEAITKTMGEPPDFQFRACVLAAHCSHYGGALFGGTRVSHEGDSEAMRNGKEGATTMRSQI
tara:strand:+ start:220 stop:492 length:273 start_codon:yes stop_codon:yes gene_type:complete